MTERRAAVREDGIPRRRSDREELRDLTIQGIQASGKRFRVERTSDGAVAWAEDEE